MVEVVHSKCNDKHESNFESSYEQKLAQIDLRYTLVVRTLPTYSAHEDASMHQAVHECINKLLNVKLSKARLP